MYFCFFPILGLKLLPPLSASSCLKKLVAENCDIQSLPDNLFHYNWEEIDLRGNKGEGDDDDDNREDDGDEDDDDNGDDKLMMTMVMMTSLSKEPLRSRIRLSPNIVQRSN